MKLEEFLGVLVFLVPGYLSTWVANLFFAARTKFTDREWLANTVINSLFIFVFLSWYLEVSLGTTLERLLSLGHEPDLNLVAALLTLSILWGLIVVVWRKGIAKGYRLARVFRSYRGRASHVGQTTVWERMVTDYLPRYSVQVRLADGMTFTGLMESVTDIEGEKELILGGGGGSILCGWDGHPATELQGTHFLYIPLKEAKWIALNSRTELTPSKLGVLRRTIIFLDDPVAYAVNSGWGSKLTVHVTRLLVRIGLKAPIAAGQSSGPLIQTPPTQPPGATPPGTQGGQTGTVVPTASGTAMTPSDAVSPMSQFLSAWNAQRSSATVTATVPGTQSVTTADPTNNTPLLEPTKAPDPDGANPNMQAANSMTLAAPSQPDLTSTITTDPAGAAVQPATGQQEPTKSASNEPQTVTQLPATQAPKTKGRRSNKQK